MMKVISIVCCIIAVLGLVIGLAEMFFSVVMEHGQEKRIAIKTILVVILSLTVAYVTAVV
mgnify:CR=1 FL=1